MRESAARRGVELSVSIAVRVGRCQQRDVCSSRGVAGVACENDIHLPLLRVPAAAALPVRVRGGRTGLLGTLGTLVDRVVHARDRCLRGDGRDRLLALYQQGRRVEAQKARGVRVDDTLVAYLS